MRTYSGCISSTPIPILHAISKFPLLEDKITTDLTLAVLTAEAQGNILGKDYRTWDEEGCLADGWTPFGKVRDAVERKAKKYNSRIHPQGLIPSDILEHLTKCEFNMSNRTTAMVKHKAGELITRNPDIAIWTDGSLNRDALIVGEEPTSGAAATVYISDPEPHSTLFEIELRTALILKNFTSSYEAEIIAIQAGLDSLLEMNPEGRHIHLFTDS